jgi:hypothetical protein
LAGTDRFWRSSTASAVSGPCRGGPNGCQFWLILVENGSDRAKTPDLAGFLVSDGSGKRFDYGVGPI